MSLPPQQPVGSMSTGAKVGIGCLGCFGALMFTAIVGSCASALAGGGSDQAGPPPPAETVTATVSEPVEPTATATEEVEVEVTVTEAETVTETATETVTAQPDSAGAGTGATGGGSVHYQNCDAARAAGAAPVRRGDAGYGRHLDRDGDGVGCE
ncbi:calcium-binding protein [Nocardiopsis sp. TSRI0078]|uniref:excalibur calcium-binding domain-containing protein n=1 Tax=unclassified Nocardiopsis TaxID=2649073 RepID=UPI00093B9F45|nr:excalibur calcium-binding domain-containing protein [Nocardiopsis sp. TSRI0078]OKI23280.1 calcium-binding protein [Nocardiopsis sp. TSRI0078]